jgi:hypothetical protein
MVARFIPQEFANRGVTTEGITSDDCSNFLLQEYSFGQSCSESISLLANQEWSSKVFSSSTSWADWFRGLPNKDFVAFMTAKLEGRALIDLGGGRSVMSDFAFLFRARAYVNVDMGCLEKDSYRLLGFNEVERFLPRAWIEQPKNREHIAFDSDHQMIEVGLKMDMLDFLSRLPDCSIPLITINGIDRCIIHTNEYADELNWQIRRVLTAGGILFGNNSVVADMRKLGREECLQRVNIDLKRCEGFILEKVVK